MSRIPVQEVTKPNTSEIEQALIADISVNTNMSDIHIAKIKKEGMIDNQYIQLVKMISTGFPNDKHNVPPEIAEYWQMRNELYTIDGVIFAAGRPLIPYQLRQSLLQDLHIGHQGTNAMKANARQRFFWPQMNNQIQQVRNNCRCCNEIAPSQRKEPQTRTPTPDYPFQQVVTDLFHMSGATYLIYADRYTGWTEVSITKNANTKTVSDILRRYFTTFGVPEEVSSDGGPPYNSHDIDTFLRSWGIKHRSSFAYFAQSNGRAESAVKSMKRILTTNISPSGSLSTDAASKALLLHRNTPPQDMGVSPAELLFGRPLTDHMPKPIRIRREWIEIANRREMAHKNRKQQADNYSQRELQPLTHGATVKNQLSKNCPKPTRKSSTTLERNRDSH